MCGKCLDPWTTRIPIYEQSFFTFFLCMIVSNEAINKPHHYKKTESEMVIHTFKKLKTWENLSHTSSISHNTIKYESRTRKHCKRYVVYSQTRTLHSEHDIYTPVSIEKKQKFAQIWISTLIYKIIKATLSHKQYAIYSAKFTKWLNEFVHHVF